LAVADPLTDPTPARANNQDDNHEQINQEFRPQRYLKTAKNRAR
jgi:hypothetical protein